MSFCTQRSNALILLEEYTVSLALIWTCFMDFQYSIKTGTVTWLS